MKTYTPGQGGAAHASFYSLPPAPEPSSSQSQILPPQWTTPISQPTSTISSPYSSHQSHSHAPLFNPYQPGTALLFGTFNNSETSLPRLDPIPSTAPTYNSDQFTAPPAPVRNWDDGLGDDFGFYHPEHKHKHKHKHNEEDEVNQLQNVESENEYSHAGDITLRPSDVRSITYVLPSSAAQQPGVGYQYQASATLAPVNDAPPSQESHLASGLAPAPGYSHVPSGTAAPALPSQGNYSGRQDTVARRLNVSGFEVSP